MHSRNVKIKIKKWKLGIFILNNADQETHQVPKLKTNSLQYPSGATAYVLLINENVFHIYIENF
jgi:hypothetical protein